MLPEYAADILYANRAGSDPAEGYVAFAAANMTGANRLLTGLPWPVLTFLNGWKTRKSAAQLRDANRIEIGILGSASLYAFVIVWKNTITLVDTVALALTQSPAMRIRSRNNELPMARAAATCIGLSAWQH